MRIIAAQRSRRPVPLLAWLLALFLANGSTAVLADLASDRERFVAAWRAMSAGALAKGRELAAGLEHYPLYPHLVYQDYRRRLHLLKADEVRAFLSANENSWVGDRLRSHWLDLLARRKDWAAFLEDYRPQSSASMQCRQLLARIRTGATQGIVQDAVPLWLVGKSQEPECDPAFELLYQSPLMTEDLIWQRIRLAMQEGSPDLAAYLARKLPAPMREWVDLWRQARANPAAALRSPRLREVDTPRSREIAAYAVERLARSNMDAAIDAWEAVQQNLDYDPMSASRVYRNLGRRADFGEHERTIALLDKVVPGALDADTQRSQLRAALRERDFQTLRRWTAQDAAEDMNALRWEYWRARALEETGARDAAVPIYRRLSQERDYYGFRAADRLGVGYKYNDYPIDLPPAAHARIAANPGIARASEFYALDMIYEARREWYHTSLQLTPEELKHAAALAHQLKWYDRAILTVAKSGYLDDVSLRFPMPFEPLVMQYASKRKLPPALIWGIMKAESAFMEDARSPVGALGLMQLMPATGRETAQRIGLKLKNTSQLLQARYNITVGSAYLRQMLDRFDGNIAMAAAGYNAGPHRVQAWRPKSGCEDAELWIEQIPFTETRRYARRALFFLAMYEWRMAGSVERLESRLAKVPPRRGRLAECSV